jgi:hypothetical protein
MQPLTLLLLAAFAASCRPLPPPLPRRCRWAATASTATTMVKLTVIHCRRKRQQQQHHQHINGSTNLITFTSPDDLDLFNFSTVFEVCDDGQGNLAIHKLLALKKMYLFCDLHTPKWVPAII